VPKVQVVDGDEAWLGRLLRGAGSVFEAVGIAVFVPFLMAFGLSEKQTLLRGFEGLLPEGADAGRAEAEVARMVRAYFLGNLGVGLGMALLQGLAFQGLGLENAAGLGLLTGFINLVPVLGLPAALLFPVAQGLLQFHRSAPFLALGAVLCALHVAAGSFVVPRYVGSQVRLNGVAATAALLFWGWLWSVAGFLLAIPLTALVKILLESSPRGAPLAALLAPRPGGGPRGTPRAPGAGPSGRTCRPAWPRAPSDGPRAP
jgi:predicted PurR-regulated permease PerM